MLENQFMEKGRIRFRWEVRIKNGRPLSGGKKGISLGLVARFFQFEVGHVRRCVVFFEYAIRISCLILCNASPES